MKYVVRMMFVHEQIIEANNLQEADKEARRVQALGDRLDNVPTTRLLSVTPIKGDFRKYVLTKPVPVR